MNDDWISGHLDGELTKAERAEMDAALADDPDLAATYAGLAEVRALLRSEAVVMPDGAADRILAVVSGATHADDEGPTVDEAPTVDTDRTVVAISRRRGVPTFAAVAAVVVVIAGIVGGIGGSSRIPALGDLVARHEVAAAVLEGAPMPDEMDQMHEMAMDDAAATAPPMPEDYAMAEAFVDGTMVHLVYRTDHGDAVSVIREEGDPDLGALGDGEMTAGAGVEVWSAPMGETHVAVVDGKGYFWIVISEAPHDDMMDDLMHDLPTRSPSVGERLRDAAEAVVAPFRF